MKPFFLLSVFSLLLSCSETVIEQEKLKEIIEDIHLTKAKITLLEKNDTIISKKEAEKQYFNIIAEKYGITKEMFDNSMKYYSDRQPKILKNIYNELHKKYTAEVDSLAKKRYQTKK